MAPRGKTVAVPEVAVDEDSDLGAAEDDIRVAWKSFCVLAKAQSATVQFGADTSLNIRVLTPHAGHTITALCQGQVIRHIAFGKDESDATIPLDLILRRAGGNASVRVNCHMDVRRLSIYRTFTTAQLTGDASGLGSPYSRSVCLLVWVV